MDGNINNHIIGKCSICGGIVSLPHVWYGVNRPIPTCESCGARADTTKKFACNAYEAAFFL